MSAGAAITAQMMYEAVTGTARPTIQTMSAVYRAVRPRLPPAYAITIEENLSPRPVSVTTPTMMPAEAQVAATPSTPTVPASIAWMSRRGFMAVSARKKLTTNAVTVAQNTLTVGEKPYIM